MHISPKSVSCYVLTAECLRSERNLLAGILVAKFTSIEKFEEVALIFSKYQSTLLPIILSGDRLQFAMLGPVNWRLNECSRANDS